MPPQGSPPDLHQTTRQAAEQMGLDPQAAPLPMNRALASEPLRALSQEINAAHAADRPEVLDRAVEAFQAVDLAYRTAVQILKSGFQMFGRDLPDWLRTQDDFVANQAPRVPQMQAGGQGTQPQATQPGTAQAPAQGTAPQPGTAQPWMVPPGTPLPAAPPGGAGQPQGAAQPAPQSAAQPGAAGQPQGAAAPAPPTQPGR
jgi:hypothetical protein